MDLVDFAIKQIGIIYAVIAAYEGSKLLIDISNNADTCFLKFMAVIMSIFLWIFCAAGEMVLFL